MIYYLPNCGSRSQPCTWAKLVLLSTWELMLPCMQNMVATCTQNIASHFFLWFCVVAISRNACLIFFSQSKYLSLLYFKLFNSHLALFWPCDHGQCVWINGVYWLHVYGFPLAMNVPQFIAFSRKVEYGHSGFILAYISTTTWTRDLKFAGTVIYSAGHQSLLEWVWNNRDTHVE